MAISKATKIVQRTKLRLVASWFIFEIGFRAFISESAVVNYCNWQIQTVLQRLVILIANECTGLKKPEFANADFFGDSSRAICA